MTTTTNWLTNLLSWIPRARRAARRGGSWLGLLLVTQLPVPGIAHDVPPSLVTLDVGARIVHAHVQLQLSELGSAMRLSLVDQAGSVIADHGVEISRYIRDHIQAHSLDGRPFEVYVDSLAMRRTKNPSWNSNDWLVADARLVAPAGASTKSFRLSYAVILERVLSHQALIYVGRDLRYGWTGENPHLIGVIGFGGTQLKVGDDTGSWWRGFARMFQLGMHHIAEGTDHLLFLLAILLPTPLLAIKARWRGRKSPLQSLKSIIAVVSGFTVGHSLTLAVAASTGIVLPARLVEILIAVSILVSAVHAWRPLFPGREPWVATGFGLIHGMAFAEALAGLNFDATSLVISLGAFNLGIEVMQLLVIVSVLPLLLALSRTHAYTSVRLAGAMVAGVAACGWIAERAFAIRNPIGPLIDTLTHASWWLAVAVCSASLTCVLVALARGYLRQTPRSVTGIGLSPVQ